MRTLINKLLKTFGYQMIRANNISLSYKLLNNYRYFHDKFERIKDIEGDIVECGVGFGHTLFLLFYLAWERITSWITLAKTSPKMENSMI